MSEVKVEAPTLSPTLAKIVLGLASRYDCTTPASFAAPAALSAAVPSDSMRPWKSLTSMMSIVVSPSAATAADGTDSATRTPAVARAAPAPRRRRVFAPAVPVVWEVFIAVEPTKAHRRLARPHRKSSHDVHTAVPLAPPDPVQSRPRAPFTRSVTSVAIALAESFTTSNSTGSPFSRLFAVLIAYSFVMCGGSGGTLRLT